MKLTVNLKEVRYKRKVALSDISFTVQKGTFTAIIGRNGCGKSTVISCIGGLLPYTGDILLDDVSLTALPPKKRAMHIAIMLQQLRTPHITVRELTAFGRSPYLSAVEQLTHTDLALIENALQQAEMTELQDCYLDKISGGEHRRAYLSMILAQNTDILILDEPTANMDMDHADHFIRQLHSLCQDGKAIAVVLHDLTQAMTADQIILLDDGKQLFSGTPNDFLENKWSERIFHAVPIITEDGRVFFTSLST